MPKAGRVLDRVGDHAFGSDVMQFNAMKRGWLVFAAVSRVRRSAGGRYSVERRTSDSSEHTREP